MTKKPVFNVYHDTGEIDNIIDSLAFVVHSEAVDFKKTSITLDEKHTVGGRLVAIANTNRRGSNDYPTITDVKIIGNVVTWRYMHSTRVGSTMIPVISVFKISEVENESGS